MEISMNMAMLSQQQMNPPMLLPLIRMSQQTFHSPLEPLQKPYLSVNGAHNLDTAIVPQESVEKINMSWQH